METVVDVQVGRQVVDRVADDADLCAWETELPQFRAPPPPPPAEVVSPNYCTDLFPLTPHYVHFASELTTLRQDRPYYDSNVLSLLQNRIRNTQETVITNMIKYNEISRP